MTRSCTETSAALPADLEGLGELESAEDFLDYFAVPYTPAIVHVNRLHILQRFHDYLAQRGGSVRYADYHDCLLRAYGDFVVSDALSEKVFRVLKRASGITTIPLTSIGRVRR